MSAHVYTQTHPNEQIDLGTYCLAVRVPYHDTDTHANPVNWTVTQTFSPSPRLELSTTDAIPEDVVFNTVFNCEREYSLNVAGCKPVMLTLDTVSCEGLTLAANTTPCQLFPPSSALSKASFCLFNWPSFRPQADAATGTIASFVIHEWLLEVIALPDNEGRIKALRKSGGYIMTHTATVRKVNHDVFSSQDLDSLLDGLHNFFSFALGKWSGPQLATAMDRENQLRYCRAGVGKLSDGENSLAFSWVDAHHISSMVEAAPGFIELFRSELWHKALGDVIYYYVNANSLGRGVNVDTSALFTQAALELLAWTYCVHDKKLVLGNVFKGNAFKAADQIRLLCTSLGIPLALPSELSGLGDGSENGQVHDLATVLPSIRNLVTHPVRPGPVHKDAYYHGWLAAQWLIEMVVLKLANYHGRYAKRFSGRCIGTVESVPWAASAANTVQ